MKKLNGKFYQRTKINMKKQVIAIHGGDTFNTYEEYIAFLKEWQLDFEKYRTHKKDWKANLADKLGEEFEVILPDMPNKINAKFAEWKIWFEKFIPFLNSEVILVGHSMGGLFLAKYLAENDFPKKITALFIVASPFDHDAADYSLGDFKLPEDLSRIEQQVNKVFLYHSEDDPVVPFVNLNKYKAKLKNATVKAFKDRQHFNQEEFAEIVEDIKTVTR